MMIQQLNPALFPTKGRETVPPVVGCNSPIDQIPVVRDWLVDGQRDLEIGDVGSWQNLDAGNWKERAAVLRSNLGGYVGRLGVHGPFVGMLINAPDPDIQAVVSRRLTQGVQFAAELGATHMVVHSPFAQKGSPFMQLTSAIDLQNNIGWVHATLDPVVRVAESLGVMLVIENINDLNPAALIATVKSFDTETVRLSIDVGHVNLHARAGGMPPSQWILETGPYLQHLHLQDNDGMFDRHWAPGDGEINWYSVFEALSTLDHQPRLIMEVKNRDNVQRGYDYFVGRGLAR
jgi:sugar phosphate isomerase/epimerase